MLIPMRIRHSNRTFDSIQPRSFIALMDMYEQNYIRLRCLCPQLTKMEQGTKLVSSLPGRAHDLHLTVHEREKHTTTLQLTYAMTDGTLRPDITIRIYHDALQAEVLSRACRFGGRYEVDHSVTDTALLCRWKLNRFLYKWLGYCLMQGHQFNENGKLLKRLQNISVSTAKKTVITE